MPPTTALPILENPKASQNVDPFGRRIDYLRISVTDRCSLRCVYCMPATGMTFAPSSALLTFAELQQVVSAAYRLGFRKFRLTGGEPLVRRGLIDFVASLHGTLPEATIALSTNGLLLETLAAPLREAGLSRINVSLDTLRADRFAALTRRYKLDAVLAGIEAALAQGFERLKINAVIVRGQNDDELGALAALAKALAVDVRFIEHMPLGGRPDAGYLDAASMLASLRTIYPLAPVAVDASAAAPTLYAAPNWRGRIGFIAPRSQKFCASCRRLRLTANGELKGCLLREGSVDLRTPLRAGAKAQEIEALFAAAIALKPWAYRDESYSIDRPMSAIGG